ncbi:MAG: esterase [Verrucomicrobia bacterium]|nr:esterase [Verrucomicrobiota bacterium]
MLTISRRLFLFLGLGLLTIASASAAEEPARREWSVDGVAREAMIYAPATAKTNACPVVFVFHGHGGNMRATVRGFGIHTHWPEAIVVYPQGLNTPGKLTDPEGKKPGWQHGAGAQGDRDLKFFDAMLASLKADYKVDAKRIYSTGHSNGGGFTYLLWAERGDKFAAFAPSASAASFLMPDLVARIARQSEKESGSSEGKGKENDDKKAEAKPAKAVLKPKPFLHLGAENDPLVKFEWQKRTMDRLRELNQCGEGKSWKDEKGATIYASKVGVPVVTYIHNGEHKFPANGPALMVKFFKDHAQP